MLLDAIILIPTIFTYCLIALLIAILCFIVVYICHKIYISIYDNLPIDHASLLINRDIYRSDQFVNQPSMRTIWFNHGSQLYHSKAVRIVVSLEICYLACVEFKVAVPKTRPISFICDCHLETATCAATFRRAPTTMQVLRYYDQLAKIPRFKLLLKCTQRGQSTRIASNMRLLLDEVIDAIDDEDSVSQTSCRPQSQRQTQNTTSRRQSEN